MNRRGYETRRPTQPRGVLFEVFFYSVVGLGAAFLVAWLA